MKNAQQMRTIFPIGLKEEIKVSTTSFRPGALLMTLGKKKTNPKGKTRKLFNLYACPVTTWLSLSSLWSAIKPTFLYLQAAFRDH